MLALAGLVYLLLSVPVTLRLLICVNGRRCWSEASAFALGTGARVDARLLWHGRLRVEPRYGHAWEAKAKDRPEAPAPEILRAFSRMASWEFCALVGLEDAAQTATATGALRAGLCALMTGMQMRGSVQVGADFQSRCFLITARCIIRAPLGDIIVRAARAAIAQGRGRARSKARKEGFTWSRTPSRA